MKNVVIIGGGAAGITAAYSIAEDSCDRNITVVEKNSRPLRKVMITGKGRCNVTNNCGLDTLIKNTTKNGKFLYSAYSSFLPADVMAFFESKGVPLKTERGNRVFPVSDKAVDIVDAMVKAVKKKGVKIIEGTAEEVLSNGERVTAVKLSDGRILDADFVIIATGGLSYPVTGSTGDGYRMAKQLGHTVTKLVPSLSALECHQGFCSKLSGLTLKNVTLSAFEEGKKKPIFSEMGEMLFTHFGVSGPLVLSASAHLRNMDKKKYHIIIDLKPALTLEQLDKRILRDFEGELNRDFQNSLDNLLPRSLIPVIIDLTGIKGNTKVNQISREQRQSLVFHIKNLRLDVTNFRPIEEAIVTSGGISVKEISPSTMESKLVKGLYFAGEIIDVDSYTGGFNLQTAFSTGYIAGKDIAKE